MGENEPINESTSRILMRFIIDVPYHCEDSIINTIILELNEYIHIKSESNIPQRVKNELLMNIQRELDSLIRLDE